MRLGALSVHRSRGHCCRAGDVAVEMALVDGTRMAMAEPDVSQPQKVVASTLVSRENRAPARSSENAQETRTLKLAERVGFFEAVFENPSECAAFSAQRSRRQQFSAARFLPAFASVRRYLPILPPRWHSKWHSTRCARSASWESSRRRSSIASCEGKNMPIDPVDRGE